MVQMPNSSKIPLDSIGNNSPRGMVKLEFEDSLEEEHGPFSKRSKLTPSPNQDMYNNVLDEPSPLGLRLRKSPSLLDLIQMKLAQANPSNSDASKKKDAKSGAISASNNERLKASNFPANILKIGNWECLSRYEGDLVAKCYYAKHKLVWEVLDGGLKSKIEIQWSDITAIKATSSEDGPGTLDVVLARPPLFFRETDPQPRKHTLWQATSDFTGGQASIHRRHYLQCPSGLLSKNFEKLVQCDPRLHLLSQQPDILLQSPFFEPRCSMFDDQLEGKKPQVIFSNDREPSFSSFMDPDSPSLSISTKSEYRDSVGKLPDFTPQMSNIRGNPSLGFMDTATSSSGQQELKNPNWWNQLNVPGLIRASMSVDDLVNHLGNCISADPSFQENSLPPKETLEDLAQYLLSDTQATSASDEKSLMARVNSLCCLIQKDNNTTTTTINNNTNIINNNINVGHDSSDEGDSYEEVEQFDSKHEKKDEKTSGGGMTRKDSYGELLMHLPRIASMPQFLYNISEDSENETR